jgi:hypothetical protein
MDFEKWWNRILHDLGSVSSETEAKRALARRVLRPSACPVPPRKPHKTSAPSARKTPPRGVDASKKPSLGEPRSPKRPSVWGSRA